MWTRCVTRKSRALRSAPERPPQRLPFEPAREQVTFTGFGKFTAQDRAARQGVNPRTSERVEIAATTVPKLSAGSQLKAAVKGT